jgi:hypothetical protein
MITHLSSTVSVFYIMDTTKIKTWNVLNWNIRGLNVVDKRNAVRAKIEESACATFCLKKPRCRALTTHWPGKWPQNVSTNLCMCHLKVPLAVSLLGGMIQFSLGSFSFHQNLL